ncbi:MAG: hypothetical protein KDE19_03090 [Caldilineaceae bacterium]|nr:hypothetical protein [Caldilineaceae bacterium]
MAILLEHVAIPERGRLELDIQQSFEIKVTAEEARRKVNRWLLEYVSYMMHADPPTLVIADGRAVWRVPAIFTASRVGEVGTVGLVDVEVDNGIMHNSELLKEQILQCAQTLAAKLPAYQPGHLKIADEYIPKDMPQAEILELDDTE